MSVRVDPVPRLMKEDVIHFAPIEEFDFEGVAYTMDAIDWRWHTLGKSPNATALREMVTELIGKLGEPIRRSDGTVYMTDNIACGGIGVMEQEGKFIAFFCRTDNSKWAGSRARKAWAKWRAQK